MSGIIGGAGSKSGVIGTTELDYEEGNWTPTNSNTLTGGPNGTYVKIGKLVLCSFYLLANASSATTGDFGGLPYTSNSAPTNDGAGAGGGTVTYTNNDSVNYSIRVNSNTKTFRFYQGYIHKQLSANKNAWGTFTYYTS